MQTDTLSVKVLQRSRTSKGFCSLSRSLFLPPLCLSSFAFCKITLVTTCTQGTGGFEQAVEVIQAKQAVEPGVRPGQVVQGPPEALHNQQAHRGWF